MGYRVDYLPVGGPMEENRRSGRLLSMVGAAFLVFVVLVRGFWPRGTALLWELFIPGDPAVTAAAFEDLRKDLMSGEAVEDSLRHFCMQILQEAGFAAD